MKGLELKKRRETAGLTQKEFADLVGKSMRTIITWEQSEELTHSQVMMIDSALTKYAITSHPDIKVNDHSEIYKTKSGNVIEELPSGKYLLTVPLVPNKAHATYISHYMDAEYISELTRVSFIVDRIPKGNYRAFEIINDSMNDGTLDKEPSRKAILNGDVVLGRELGKQHWNNKLKVKEFPFWIIVHKDTTLCKEIIHHDVENGTIICHSLNDSPEYRDFELSLNDVHQLFNIIKKQV